MLFFCCISQSQLSVTLVLLLPYIWEYIQNGSGNGKQAFYLLCTSLFSRSWCADITLHLFLHQNAEPSSCFTVDTPSNKLQVYIMIEQYCKDIQDYCCSNVESVVSVTVLTPFLSMAYGVYMLQGTSTYLWELFFHTSVSVSCLSSCPSLQQLSSGSKMSKNNLLKVCTVLPIRTIVASHHCG